MKTSKKIIFLTVVCVLALCLLVGLTACKDDKDPQGPNETTLEESEFFDFAFATDGYTLTAVKGDYTEYVIPAEFKGRSVVRIADEAFSGRTNVTKVTLPTTINEIGQKAFYGCSELSELIYGDESVTVYSLNDKFYADLDETKINEEAFNGTKVVKNIAATSEGDGTNVTFALYDGAEIKSLTYLPAMNDRVKEETEEKTVEVTERTVKADFGNYGIFRSAELKFTDANDKNIAFSQVEIGVSADEYNIAYIVASYPVLTFCLQMSEYTDNFTVPTIMALGRSWQVNFDALPENVFTIPTLKKAEARGNVGDYFDEAADYIKDLYTLNPAAKFNAYLNDVHMNYYLRMFVATGIPDENLTVTLLSDGTCSTKILTSLFAVDNPVAKYEAVRDEWNEIVNYTRENGYNYDKISEMAHTSISGYAWPQYYFYILLKENSVKTESGNKNVSWLASRLRTGENLRWINEKSADFANEIISLADQKNVGAMFSALNDEQKTQLKAIYKFDENMFSAATESGKEIMIIIDAYWNNNGVFENYLKMTMDYYGDGYVYYYKGHPATATIGEDERQQMYDSLKEQGYEVEEVDASINAELFIFFMPEIKMCGFGSTTYDSANDDICKMLWNVSKESAKNNSVMAKYSEYFDEFATMIDSSVTEYKGIRLDENSKYALIELNDVTDAQKAEYNKHEFAIYCFDTAKVNYYKLSADGTTAELVDKDGVPLMA